MVSFDLTFLALPWTKSVNNVPELVRFVCGLLARLRYVNRSNQPNHTLGAAASQCIVVISQSAYQRPGYIHLCQDFIFSCVPPPDTSCLFSLSI